jgi:hypothetical protein
MSLSYLGALGAIDILRSAGGEVAARGFAHLMPCDPYSGQINAVGALALACGAKDKELKAWSGDLEFVPIPDIKHGIFMELIGFIESLIDDDIDAWCEEATQEQCIKLFEQSATRIEIAVI